MDCIDSLKRMAAGGRARRANVRILPRLMHDEQKRGPVARGRHAAPLRHFAPVRCAARVSKRRSGSNCATVAIANRYSATRRDADPQVPVPVAGPDARAATGDAPKARRDRCALDRSRRRKPRAAAPDAARGRRARLLRTEFADAVS
ncbi:hypothetical protein, partial [Burkholderia humptydooensis]|uniref:hypothetical protein n=1 Tax=Burkholderia humptydooensis TaxID=430531 RepID=UPI001E60C0A4